MKPSLWPLVACVGRWVRLHADAADAPPQAYVGRTDPIDVVIQRVNANAARVPSLWTELDYSARLVDPQSCQTTALSGDGSLQYRRPGSLRLVGDKDVAGEVFQLGCNGDQFWCKLRTTADASDYWWGHLDNVGKPCCGAVPIRPDLVVEVLGVGLTATNLLEQPVPVMRFDNERGEYVFDFDVRRPDRWVVQREVAYSRTTFLPTRVSLFDDAGRMVLRAELSDARPIGQDGVPADRQPRVARTYDLWFPDTGSTMTLRLNDPALTHAGRRGELPNDASFRRPGPIGADHVMQVDERCAGDGVTG